MTPGRHLNAAPGLAILSASLLLAACTGAATQPAPVSVPPTLLGAHLDDYGTRWTIQDSLVTHAGSRYHVTEWHPAEQFLVARADSANRGQPGRWVRFDWMPLREMAPWAWGACLTEWDAPTAGAARGVPPPERATPRTGCRGFPFTRLRHARTTATVTPRPTDLTGCHVLSLGGWSSPPSVVPPTSVALHLDAVTTPHGLVGNRLEPVLGLVTRRPETPIWTLTASELRLTWASEFHGVVVTLLPSDDGWTGTARSWSHVLRLEGPPPDGRARMVPDPTAEVVMRRCGG